MKQLIIELKTLIREGNREVWNDLQAPESFVNEIKTPDLEVEHTNINQVVSGLPNPFARALMFQYAIEASVGNNPNATGGMMAYYQTLRDEWKGLIGCISLDSAPISISSIPLAYADGKSFDATHNLLEVGGALGNMLFDDKKYWCDENEWRSNPTAAVPLIHLIRYHGTIIGATAPKSLFFTPPFYKITPQVPFYQHGRFQDPLQSELSPSQTQILYTYVEHICNNYHRYTTSLMRNGEGPDVGALLAYLTRWKTEIQAYARSRGYGLVDNSIATNINIFPAPFDTLFNTTVTLYGFNGQIFREQEGNQRIPFDPSELLVPHDSSTLVRILFEDGLGPAQNAAYLLPATSEKGTVHLSLPLTEKGILIFQNTLDQLLGDGGNLGSRITARYNAASGTALVELRLILDGQPIVIERTYRNLLSVSSHKVILWPDFYSPSWSAYFYYSELPHNANNPIRLFPLQADLQNYLLLHNGHGLQYLIAPDKLGNIGADGEFMVRHEGFFDSNALQYEIIKSQLPIKGVEIRVSLGAMTNQLGGYILARSRNVADPYVIENRGSATVPLQTVKVGFDFGSNNICVSYADTAERLHLLRFNNRRRYLVGTAQPNVKVDGPAKPHQVFFFQERLTEGNQVKSMIMTHDLRRLSQSETAPPRIGDEISGGLPVFEQNLPVENSTDTIHEVNFGQMEAKIKYNLKWSTDADENQFKHSLLKTLWLKVQAELFASGLRPSDLSWAYPSAMSKDTVQGYFNLWQNVVLTNGFSTPAFIAQPAPYDSPHGGSALTESEAVCNFALTAIGQMEQRPNYLIFGFDVGGSTTDILCIQNLDVPTLIKQSSVRLSAGLLAEATSRSANIRAALQRFCNQRRIFIYGIDKQLTPSTSAYFFNAILDRLSSQGDQQLNLFYSDIFASGCKDIFVVNAYLTGLLFFYAGQLTAKVIQDKQLVQINMAQFGFYGKGGRMFDWLPAVTGGAANRYYEACFYEGLGKRADFGIEIKRRSNNIDGMHHVKSEVSFGLAAARRVNVTEDRIHELVGEEGFVFRGHSLNALSDATSEIFHHLGRDLAVPTEFLRFKQFLRLFQDFTRQQFNLHLESQSTAADKMGLIGYITNLSEYLAAKRVSEGSESPFGFEAPLIILEGMCFLKQVLMNQIFK